MKISIGALLGIWVAFTMLYCLFLRYKNAQNKTLVLSRAYMKKLFTAAENANIETQGDDEVAIENVEFGQEDFKDKIQKINWKRLEKELACI